MKKALLILVAALVAGALGQGRHALANDNLMDFDTSWEVLIQYDYDPTVPPAKVKFLFSGSYEANGHSYQILSVTDRAQYPYYDGQWGFRTEEGKTYALPLKAENPDEILLYDFSINEGEICKVNTAGYGGQAYGIAQTVEPYYAKCIGRENTTIGGIPITNMVMEYYSNPECNADSKQMEVYWIEGLGSYTGPIPYYFPRGLAGTAWIELLRITRGDEILFENPTADVITIDNKVGNSPRPRYGINGLPFINGDKGFYIEEGKVRFNP